MRGQCEWVGVRDWAYLVAGEAEDDEALILVLLVESLEALILGCEAAVREGERKQLDIQSSTAAHHLDATFTMRTTLPLSCSKSYVLPPGAAALSE